MRVAGRGCHPDPRPDEQASDQALHLTLSPRTDREEVAQGVGMSKQQELDEKNEALDSLGQEVFGGEATLRIVDPRKLVLLKSNARYFKKEAFKQLVENLRKDKRLSSVPLCRTTGKGVLEVLSGNHRVMAAIEAGLDLVMVMVLLGNLGESRRLSIQLSHNALVGQDDPRILADLWAKIGDIKDRLYAGLSSGEVKELDKIKLVSFSTPSLTTRAMTFAFTDPEAERVSAIIEELSAFQASQEMFLADIARFNEFFDALQAAKAKYGIKNASLAMLKLVELAGQAMEADK